MHARLTGKQTSETRKLGAMTRRDSCQADRLTGGIYPWACTSAPSPAALPTGRCKPMTIPRCCRCYPSR